MALTPHNIVRFPAPALRPAGSLEIIAPINARWLDSVRFVATSGVVGDVDAGSAIDGVTVAAGDSFLYQPVSAGIATLSVSSGIYIASAAGVAPVRRSDANTGAELLNAAVHVREGTAGGGQGWICANVTAPLVGTDGIIFRLFQTGVDIAGSTLAASAGIPTYADAADVVSTAGYNVYSDAGGMTWKRRTSTIPDTLTYFRKQDFGGIWYEAVSKRTILGESIGIFGAGTGTDVGPNINDAIAWLGSKGGGRLVLPPGVCNSAIDLVCDTDGVWIQGTSTGSSNNSTGTLFRLAADKTFHIGTAGGTERYSFKCSDLQTIQDPASAAYFFTSHKVRNMRFRDIQVRACYGFLKAGDQINGSVSKMIFMEGIEGNLDSTSGNFIEATNIGAFFLSNVVVEGAASPPPGQTFLNFPDHNDNPVGFVQNIADGSIITGCGASLWDYGIKIEWGVTNLFVANSWFDRCKTSALWVSTAGGVNAMRFSNCHFVGITPGNTSQVGINLSENGSTISRVEISGSTICHFGKGALRIGEDPDSNPAHVAILGNQFEDNCSAVTDGTESVILIGGDTNNIKVSGNQIYKVSSAPSFVNKPKYGINIQTDTALIEVTDNQISGIHSSGSPILNPFRGPAATRKVNSNSGQVLEGQVVTVGPWSVANQVAGQTDVDVELAAIIGLSDAVILRRGQVLSIAARANDNVTSAAGSVTFKVTKNGVNTTLLCTTTGAPVAEAYAENLDGIDFLAGDQLGVHVTTTAGYLPVTLEWAVFINIVYD